MPISQEDLEEPPRRKGAFPFDNGPDTPRDASFDISPPTKDFQRYRGRLSEESIRTDLYDVPGPDCPVSDPLERDVRAISDRAELIERLKRGESPAWVPNGHAGLRDDRRHSHPYSPLLSHGQLESVLRSPTQPAAHPPRSPPRDRSVSPNLLPPAQITPEKDWTSEDERRLRDGLTVERPRSALHSGDFTQNGHGRAKHTKEEGPAVQQEDHSNIQSPRPHRWAATSPPRPSVAFLHGLRTSASAGMDDFRSVPSSLSSSLSSSFVYMPPTSPLAQSESNDDLGEPLPMTGIDLDMHSPYPPRPGRRPSYPSISPTPLASPSPTPSSTLHRNPSFRRETTFPYQAHQPRRSLASTPNSNTQGPPSTSSSITTPAHLRSRRPSFSSDTSPLHHASMVGSYEESILLGRMSTTPSKPFEFLAQIGVLGLGKCKASLRCPPHVTLPFPAVFYNYPGAAVGRPGDDGPSPYVGQIDLENGLANAGGETRARRKMQSRAERAASRDDVNMDNAPSAEGGGGDGGGLARRPSAPRRRSGSPRAAPPGGSYRIPEKGRIQIIIKNQNKTAVKLFLVPYDLAGMEPGTKTFIRQRSYSVGPIIDGLPPPPATAAAAVPDPADERPVLRYLIHLHICCPSKGRFYLYRNLRVVFANRVPDGKCKLRNETMWPDPRFSPYKSVRSMHPPATAPSRSAAMLAADKAHRRRSTGYYHQPVVSRAPLLPPPVSEAFRGSSSSSSVHHHHHHPDPPVPVGPGHFGPSDGDSGSSESSPRGVSDGSEEAAGHNRYEKLSKGDVGYGGNAFFGSAGAGGSPGEEGLLSMRLRGLGVRPGEED